MKNLKVLLITTIFALLLGACAAPIEESAAETARLVESERASAVDEPALVRVTSEPTSDGEDAMDEDTSVEAIDATQRDESQSVDTQQVDSAPIAMPAAIQSLAVGIMADAAERSGISADKLTVVSAESVTWNDGSLGCPQPDMMYTMSLIEGYKLVVSAEGQQLNYHTDGSNHFVYCENADK